MPNSLEQRHKKQKQSRAEKNSLESWRSQSYPKLKFLHIKNVIITHSIVSTFAYVIMIEGLGKGVKYSLFVANAIIFVSSKIKTFCSSTNLTVIPIANIYCAGDTD